MEFEAALLSKEVLVDDALTLSLHFNVNEIFNFKLEISLHGYVLLP